MKSDVERARSLALELHVGQVDKAGAPYYLHPFAVADKVGSDAEKTVAYLHDTVEDGVYTIGKARQDFGDEVADALDAITRRKGEPYMDYIDRVKQNPIARAVKVADLSENMNLWRMRDASPEDIDRAVYRIKSRYIPAYKRLKTE
ncbi:MAG: HD domain-containing protein [Christensenellales bacterium]|jgi:(p)ppGpp synthase/HD superfamily hydrolase